MVTAGAESGGQSNEGGASTAAVAGEGGLGGNGGDGGAGGVESCAPTAPGAPGVVPLSGLPQRLLADPVRCLLYGLVVGKHDEVLVIDTDAKQERARLKLPAEVSGLSISADGASLVGFDYAKSELVMVDLASQRVVGRVAGTGVFAALSAGRVAYVRPGSAPSQPGQLVVADPRTGLSFSEAIEDDGYEPKLVAAPDGTSVFLLAAALERWDVGGPSLVRMASRALENGSVYLEPLNLFAAGDHVYSGAYSSNRYMQLAADELNGVRGALPEPVLAENARSTIAVTSNGVYDAQTFRRLRAWGSSVASAAFTSADEELWTYDVLEGELRYANVADFVDGAELGAREWPPTGTYSYWRLIADPLRPRLYGLDGQRGVVVALDRTTLEPLAEVVVGSVPRDLAIDPTGQTLYVGFTETTAFARIDLASFQFDGLVPWRRSTYEIEALSGDRVAVADARHAPVVLDSETGELLSPSELSGPEAPPWNATLSASATGDRLFIGESYVLPNARVEVHDVAGGALNPISNISFEIPGPAAHERWSLMLPDGLAVFHSRFLLSTANLNVKRYGIPSEVYAVSPDGRVATTSSSVLRVSDGATLGTLPLSSFVQAISPDSKLLYAAFSADIDVINLEAYQ